MLKKNNDSCPLVSVIVRSMDRSELSEALDSVATQTYANIEVVLVNARGMCHREMGESCGRFPLRLVNGTVQLSRSQAANKGLDNASGEYIIFLDDDDWFEAEHIEKLVHAIETQPEFKVVYSGTKSVDGSKNPLQTEFTNQFDPIQLVAGNYIPIHAALFSRKLLDLGCRMDESLDVYEDWDFWIQASILTDFLFIGGLSAVYRVYQVSRQSGAGINAESVMIEKASLIVLKKWLPRLQDGQLIELMEAAQLSRIKDRQLDDKELHIKNLTDLLDKKDIHLKEKDYQVQEKDRGLLKKDDEILKKDHQLQEKDCQMLQFENTIQQLLSSTSWKITRPLRWVKRKILEYRRHWNELQTLLDHQGGGGWLLYKIFWVLKREGVKSLATRAKRFFYGNSVDSNNLSYQEWIRQYDVLDDEARAGISSRIDAMPSRPKISIIMPVFDPPLQFLDAAIWSVRTQLYSEWELCIADDASQNAAISDLLKRHAKEDARIKVVFRTENGHISHASNSALELTSGNFVALLDHDDLLPEHALFCVAEAILANPDVNLIYSDEDKISLSGERIDPYFKSNWNPELFLGHNLISHLGVYRTEIMKAIGGFRSGYEGSQDYDLAARFIERIRPEQIVHIPRVLYHWRVLPGSTSMGIGEKPYALIASEKALNEHLSRRGIKGLVEALPVGLHQLKFELPENPPLVSIIIPTRNAADLVRACTNSIFERTTYKNYEIILIDNGSDDPSALRCFEGLQAKHDNFRVIRDDRAFNFAALNNSAIKHANGELIALLNNDTEVITPGWLNEMVSIALQQGIGAVGAKLWYSNNLLQHGGVTLGLGANGIGGHMHHKIPMDSYGYFGRAMLTQEVSAVTAACLVVRKKVYLQVGGLNEKDLKVAFNDVDFCLKLNKAGYRNIWTPFAELYHRESATRGLDDIDERKIRFAKESLYMQHQWGDILLNDPAYNPNLTLDAGDFGLAWPPRVKPLFQTHS